MPVPLRHDFRVYLGLGALAAALAAPWLLRRRPAAALSLGVFIAFYLPASGLVRLSRTMADSYLYLPLAGLVIAFASFVARSRFSPLAAALVLLYLPLQRERAAQYRSNVALYDPVWRAYPDSPDAWKWIADAHTIEGDERRGIVLYERLERLFPDYRRGIGNKGLAYLRAGALDRAEEALCRADPTPNVLANYAELLRRRGPKTPPRCPERARAADAADRMTRAAFAR